MGSDDYRRELAELAALTAEHLRHEMDMANPWLPEVPAPPAGVAADAVGDPSSDPTPRTSERPSPPSPAPPRVAVAASSVAPAASSAAEPDVRLVQLAEEAAACTRCRLHEGRTKSVFARGSSRASLVFIGEGPGYHEDQEGVPFVGRAGQLLDKMIAAMGFGPDEVYICNVVKCRPPENRTPKPDEAAACMPFLEEQLRLVNPDVIVALGRHAAENLGLVEAGKRWRGVWGARGSVPVMPTYHPAYLLRNPENKRVVWQDLQAVVKKMGRELPSRG